MRRSVAFHAKVPMSELLHEMHAGMHFQNGRHRPFSRVKRSTLSVFKNGLFFGLSSMAVKMCRRRHIWKSNAGVTFQNRKPNLCRRRERFNYRKRTSADYPPAGNLKKCLHHFLKRPTQSFPPAGRIQAVRVGMMKSDAGVTFPNVCQQIFWIEIRPANHARPHSIL